MLDTLHQIVQNLCTLLSTAQMNFSDESNGNKYLKVAPTGENKGTLKKCE